MPSWRLLNGDVRERLAEIPDGSVHCVVTSPPYFGLRDYGCAPTAWGGSRDCVHSWEPIVVRDRHGDDGTAGGLEGSRNSQAQTRGDRVSAECRRCGAWRGELGHEPLHDCVAWARGEEICGRCYVCHLVEVFRAVRRILREDGTLWLNLGDCYARSGGDVGGKGRSLSHMEGRQRRMMAVPEGAGLRPKNIVAVPWRAGLALQADGWNLRAPIVWIKPNTMPESVTDRPTRSYEHVLLLAKSERYFYDADAVREPHQPESLARQTRGRSDHHKWVGGGPGGQTIAEDVSQCNHPAGRNMRDSWVISTRPFSEAHFAVFPPELPERCVRAGTSDGGCCAECGTPMRRITEVDRVPDAKAGAGAMRGAGHFRLRAGGPANRDGRVFEAVAGIRTVGWGPTCACGSAETRPCLVLDPFAGSGTTLLVANRLGRDAVGVELNPEYAAMARNRLRADNPLLAREAE